MRRTEAQGQEVMVRIGEVRRGAKKRKQPLKSYRGEVENEGELCGRSKKRRCDGYCHAKLLSRQ